MEPEPILMDPLPILMDAPLPVDEADASLPAEEADASLPAEEVSSTHSDSSVAPTLVVVLPSGQLGWGCV